MPQGQSTECPICAGAALMSERSGFSRSVNCPVCGHFNMSLRVAEDLRGFPKHILSGITRNYWEMNNSEFKFTVENCESKAAFYKAVPFAIPSDTDIPEKANLILRHLQRKSTYPGEIITLTSDQNFSIGFCNNKSEFGFCRSYLVDLKLIEFVPNPVLSKDSNDYRITPSGWAYLSGIGSDAKDQGFIAMWYKSELKPVSDLGLCPGIACAGYKPLRIDSKDHNNHIDDEIVAEIRKSKFIVADLTGKNAGAYFEAGFAMGLGKPVIWTCQQSEIDAGNVHFDTRQYSIVSWEPDKLEDFAKRLTQRIEATIGRGHYVASSK